MDVETVIMRLSSRRCGTTMFAPVGLDEWDMRDDYR